MDKATFIGLVGGIAIIIAAVAIGADLISFVNLPGLMIVLGGTLAATLIKFPLRHLFNAFHVAYVAFHSELDAPSTLIRRIDHLAKVARSEKGLIGLDEEPIAHPFLKKGIQLAADGQDVELVEAILVEDMQLALERHEVGQKIFRAIGESAPAFGMIGTLIGLVQMLTQLQEPASIGPAMAIALLTTLYGALIANLIALPIADKLELRGLQERVNQQLIIEGIKALQSGQNPRLIDELLEAFIPRSEREQLSTELSRSLTRGGDNEEAKE